MKASEDGSGAIRDGCAEEDLVRCAQTVAAADVRGGYTRLERAPPRDASQTQDGPRAVAV